MRTWRRVVRNIEGSNLDQSLVNGSHPPPDPGERRCVQEVGLVSDKFAMILGLRSERSADLSGLRSEKGVTGSGGSVSPLGLLPNLTLRSKVLTIT